MDTVTERCFPAQVEQLEQILPFVLSAAGRAGLGEERLQRLELALEEAVVNICHHAYGVAGGPVVVRCSEQAGAFVVELADEGEAFDPLAAPPPNLAAPLDERRVGGLGIYLIKRLMDDVQYRRENGRNVLRLVLGRG